MLDPIPLQRAQVVRVAQLGPQLFEDGPVPLLPLASDLVLEVALELGRDVIVVDERVVHVGQEADRMSGAHRPAVSSWPPDAERVADSTLSAKCDSPRELNRS